MAKDRKKLREQNKAKKAQWFAQRQQGLVQTDIHKEIAYIIGRAQQGEGRIVSIGALILMSTPTGDAWAFDAEDNYAMCLAEEGVAQPTRIFDSESQFTIDWDQRFHVEGDRLIIVDRAGRATMMEGCPEILDAIQQARRA